MHTNIAEWSVVKLKEVFHVGLLDVSQKSNQGKSQEGNGLSVSLHPHAWAEIAQLGGARKFRLSKATGTFLDYHALREEQRLIAQNWALRAGLTVMLPRWRVEWHDSEIDERTFLFTESPEEATEEAEALCDDSVVVSTVTIPCATATLDARIGFSVADMMAPEMALTCMIEDLTALDGIWWEDRLDIVTLSAPRGVINLRRLPSWHVEDLGLLDPYGEE